MPKENIIPIENKKPVAEVRWWDYQEVKKSSLSPVARSKVINKSGSNYVSENKEGYGACSYSGCPYSNRFHLRVSLGEITERVCYDHNSRFPCIIDVDFPFYFYTNRASCAIYYNGNNQWEYTTRFFRENYWKAKYIETFDIDTARDFYRWLRDGNIKVVKIGDSTSNSAVIDQGWETRRATKYFKEAIEKHERGEEIDEKEEVKW